MEIFFYQAECGDAARVRYTGTDGKPHNIFIDAGYERTYRHVLSSQIREIQQAGEHIDLWIISHIHDDHIGGVLAYQKAIIDGQTEDIVKAWYYNPPRASTIDGDEIVSSSISAAKSISQGDNLASYLTSKGMLPNTDITTELPDQQLFGCHMKVLSPSPAKLQQLRNKYPVAGHKMLEQNELSDVSEAKAAKGYDYHIPIEAFSLNDWEEDQSVENGSSIAVLSEFEGKRVLWLADAHPSTIVASLRQLGYSKENPLICDWVKVTHHGSKANNSDQLYELIRCNNYVMSVNGENKHYLPAKECIARILRNPNRPLDSKYHFYFTYDNETLRNIFRVDKADVYEIWNFSVHYLKRNSSFQIQ